MKSEAIKLLLVSACAALTVGETQAEDKTFSLSAAYREECGSCHLAYPPALLSAASWRAVMAGLERHFGTDASLDAAKTVEIGQYLQRAAAVKQKYQARDEHGRPLLRLTDGPWFRRQHRPGHDGISAGVWNLPSVKSPANCAACHRGAEQGSYSEDQIEIPRS